MARSKKNGNPTFPNHFLSHYDQNTYGKNHMMRI